MGKEKIHIKKHTIFRLFLVPLIGIMLTQSLLTLGILISRQALGALEDYSVNMMSRTVENRKVILENDLVLCCATLGKQQGALGELLETYLAEEGISLEELLADPERRRGLLDIWLPKCLTDLQSVQATGIFLILTGEDMAASANYDGFWIRDSDPRVNNPNNTDLLFERGAKELSRNYNVPLDTSWTTFFHMAGQGVRKSDDFFYEPWRAGLEHPDADTADMGYWSEPFILEDHANDSHEMISYSMPLMYEGKVYAVLGIELSSSVLYDYFSLSELSEKEQSGYLLALSQGDGCYKALVGKGILYSEVVENSALFFMEETKYGALCQMRGGDTHGRRIYAVSSALKLYDRFAPYEDTEWVLVGLNTEDELFGMSHRLYIWIGVSLLLGLAFAVAGIYVIVRHLTRPIKNLMGCIVNDGKGLEDFPGSNILEIDALYHVINDLTDRQEEAEKILLEEKERYRLAVESTNDILFTYDFAKQQLDIVNHPTQNGTCDCSEGCIFDPERVYYKDREVLEGILQDKNDRIYREFRYIFSYQNDYRWYALYGKIVKNASGERYKLVGGLRDIQEQKEQEKRQQARVERDSVTGLYAYRVGRANLEQERQAEPRGIMIYLMLDKLQEINETNGIVFGDMILEELGRCIRECCRRYKEGTGNRSVAIRIDGDEFAIWLAFARRGEAEQIVKEIFHMLAGMFETEVYQLHASAGLAIAWEDEESMELLRRAKYAMLRMIGRETDSFVFYEDIPAGVGEKLPVLEGRPVISNNYGEDVNLASLALNLFGRGANLRAQMALILRKLGYHYGASDVLTTIIHPDFHSNYLEYQWHREPVPGGEHVTRYTDEEWSAFQEWLGMRQICLFKAEESESPVLQKFLNIRQGQSGIVLPMHDSGSYMGNVCIIAPEDTLTKSAEEQQQQLGAVRDVLQSQINQQQHDLASRAKSDFLSRMSHEIRTPMNGIIGMTTIALQPGQSQEKMTDCLNKIQNSSQYLLGLINDILDMSKIESGKMHLEAENFDLREMLESLAELMRSQMEAKEIEFVQEIHMDSQWFVADKMRISQVLINLLGNAVKFTPQGGRIVLTAEEKGGKGGRVGMYFAVEDNGVGISEEDQKRVFRSFEQAGGSNSSAKQQGTGLGLSISSRLVQMMGGVIALDSELGKGSRFSFEIALEPGHSETKAMKEEEKISFEGYHVLLVEDNELNMEIAKYLLEDHGFTVDCAYNGEEAVERIKSAAPGTYDVVLMDIMMPVMDGLEATRVIRGLDREDCRTLPIIAMSANAFDDDMKKSVECGMNGHLTKPVEVDKLYRMLQDILKPS